MTSGQNLSAGNYYFRTKDGHFAFHLGGKNEPYVDVEFVADAETVLDPNRQVAYTRPHVCFVEDFSKIKAPGDFSEIRAVLWGDPEDENPTSDITIEHFGRVWNRSCSKK